MNQFRINRTEAYVVEHLIITWGRLFVKWLDIEDIKYQKFLLKAIQEYFSFFNTPDKDEEFPNLANF